MKPYNGSSIGIAKWAGQSPVMKIVEKGEGDSKLILWRRGGPSPGHAIETNGDPIFDTEAGFESFVEELFIRG